MIKNIRRREKMKKKTAEQKYRELISFVQVLSIRARGEGKQEVYENLRNLEKYLEKTRAQSHLCMLSEKKRTENVKYEELLKYINKTYDGTEASLNAICREIEKRKKIEAQQKYREVTSYIKILSYRAINENNTQVYAKLNRLTIYLDEVKKQKDLCQISEKDRTENVRYEEVLGYINDQYDGTEETLKTICRELDKREDIDEVLKYHDKKNNEKKEEER